MEKIADLRYPPGNIAVSSTGRIFVSLHPDGHPPYKICGGYMISILFSEDYINLII